MSEEYTPKTTKGELKMDRYLEDLVRNKEFQRKIKRLRRNDKYNRGPYDSWTSKEKEEGKFFDKEIGEIIDSYEKLRKRCNKLLGGDYWKTKKAVSEVYNLDSEQIAYIESLFDTDNKEKASFWKSMADFDMCKTYDLSSEELSPSWKGEEIIYLNKRRQLFLNAYPVGIFIHPKAAKNDVLDFIEKRWNWIENNFLRSYANKKLKYGKRKHSQKLLDFLWSSRFLPPKKLKDILDKEFPKNGLVYYEITKILQTEKNKRLGNSS